MSVPRCEVCGAVAAVCVGDVVEAPPVAIWRCWTPDGPPRWYCTDHQRPPRRTRRYDDEGNPLPQEIVTHG